MGSKPSKGLGQYCPEPVAEQKTADLDQIHGKDNELDGTEPSEEESDGDGSSKTARIRKNTDFKDIRERVEASMDFLNSSQDFSERGVLTNLMTISRVYHALKGKRLKELYNLCSLLLQRGILRIFSKLWDVFHDDKVTLYSDVKGIKFRILKKIKFIFLNYSNKCAEFATACFKDEKVIARLMTELTFPDLAVENLRNFQRRQAINTTLGILINLVQHCNSNKEHIRKNGGIDKLLNYARSTFLIIKAKVYIILAYCIDEDENDIITAGESVIKFIINLLCSALSSTNHVAKSYGFSAEETVAALNRLASSDENKKKIVEAGVLSELSKILRENDKVNEGEQYEAVNCVWTLAFHPDNRSRIIREPSLVDAIQHIQRSSRESGKETLHKACSSALFVLGLEEIGEHPRPSEKHIMISYNWEVQDVVLKLRDFLKENGYEVWIDVEKMQDSILGAMADAVENASIVVVAMTESYKNSNPCRTEAEYAYKRSVPVLPLLLQSGYVADGWLGAMVGTKLYVDLSSGIPNQRFDEVKRQIANIASSDISSRNVKDLTSAAATTSTVISKAAPTNMAYSQEIYGSAILQSEMFCSKWTKDQVRDWYNTLAIEDRQVLPNFDGNSLSQLCKMLVRSPDNYYRVIRDDLHFSVQDMLTFTSAIESLLLR